MNVVNFKRKAQSAKRAWEAWILTIALVGLVYHFAPQQLPIFFYKLMFVTLGGVVGFWVYTWIFGRVDDMPVHERTHARYQRIAFMCFSMLAVSLGT